MRRPTVITGLGPVTAFGIGIDPLWDAMLAGRSAIARITQFDPSGFRCQVAAEFPRDRFEARSIVPKSYRKATKVMCRDIDFAVGAADAAVRDAGLVTHATDPDTTPTIPPSRFGCHIGAGLISADLDELTASLNMSRAADGSVDLAHWGSAGMQTLTPLWLLKYLPNMLACHVTIVHACRGPSNTITCCESSSTLSLGESMRVIERGDADACLSGGAEHKLNPMAYIRQQFTGRLAEAGKAESESDPAGVVRPFDPESTGTVLGDGGGLLVIEAEESAAARGARGYASVAGFAATQSLGTGPAGIDIAEGDPSLQDALALALEDAGIGPDAVDAVVPFGSGIPAVDAAEAAALRATLGDRAAEVPIVTTVPFVGSLSSGNGAVAVAIAAKCLGEQKLPARLNTRGAVGLDADACPARDATLRHVLVTTTAQGGQNAVVVLKRYEGSSR